MSVTEALRACSAIYKDVVRNMGRFGESTLNICSICILVHRACQPCKAGLDEPRTEHTAMTSLYSDGYEQCIIAECLGLTLTVDAQIKLPTSDGMPCATRSYFSITGFNSWGEIAANATSRAVLPAMEIRVATRRNRL